MAENQPLWRLSNEKQIEKMNSEAENLPHNPEFRRLNAEREGGRPDFEVGKAGSNPVSAIKKRDTRENLVSFFYTLRLKKRCFTPIGRRCAKIKLDENMGFARL